MKYAHVHTHTQPNIHTHRQTLIVVIKHDISSCMLSAIAITILWYSGEPFKDCSFFVHFFLFYREKLDGKLGKF